MSPTLLLADDSVTIQRVIELTFADEDITVVAVSDGDQAIARIEASPPDIVLADIGMPGKNGYEVAQYIKQSPTLSRIPVMLLTGAFEPVDQARAAEAGCDGILAKPFEPQLVISRVRELLGRGSGPRPVENMSRVAPAPAATPPPAPSSRNTAEYFDRLDAAFSSAAAAPPAALVAAANMMKPPARVDDAHPPDDMDLSIVRPSAPPVDLPLSEVPGPVERPRAEPHPAATVMPPAQPALAATVVQPPPRQESAAANSVSDGEAVTMMNVGDNDVTRRVMIAPAAAPMPAQPVQIPALADAFAALLAAEQAEPLPPSVPTWPASGPPTDVIAEQVIRRVLDQMSDRVVRETVTQLVSSIAERLVREEIEKIKASVK